MRPFRGVVGFDLDLETIADRCQAFAPLLREGQAFSHTTALALHGAPLPASAEADDLHISVLFPRTPPRGEGVRGHALRRLATVRLRGLPVAEAAEAWCQAASVLDREDLVAAGDALLTGRRVGGRRSRGAVTMEELGRAAERHRGSPGAARVAWALPRLRSGVDSRAESHLRLVCTRQRLPEPEVDHPVPVRRDLVLHADLAWPDARIALEYEGDIHRVDRETWMRDLQRRELFEDAGWRVIRVTAADLRAPAALAARLRSLRARRAS